MPGLELRPARRSELDAIVGLLRTAELPVEDLTVAMLDAFVVATDGDARIFFERKSGTTMAAPSPRLYRRARARPPAGTGRDSSRTRARNDRTPTHHD